MAQYKYLTSYHETLDHVHARLLEKQYSEAECKKVLSAFEKLWDFAHNENLQIPEKLSLLDLLLTHIERVEKQRISTTYRLGFVAELLNNISNWLDRVPKESFDGQYRDLSDSYRDAVQVVDSKVPGVQVKDEYLKIYALVLKTLQPKPKSILEMLSEKVQTISNGINDFDYTAYDNYMRKIGRKLIEGSQHRFDNPSSYFWNVDRSIRMMADEAYIDEKKSVLDIEKIAKLQINLGVACLSSIVAAVCLTSLGLETLAGVACLAAVGSAAALLLCTGVFAGQILAASVLYTVSFMFQAADLVAPYLDYAICQVAGHSLKALGELLEQDPSEKQKHDEDLSVTKEDSNVSVVNTI
jgi:hypothetical protein